MRLIHVKLEKIRNGLFVKIPDLIAKSLHLKEGEDIEISIHSEPSFAQGELWGDKTDEIEEINDIFLDISEDLHTLNMYNRIYVPESYFQNAARERDRNDSDVPRITTARIPTKIINVKLFKTNSP